MIRRWRRRREQKLIDAGWNSAIEYIQDEFLAGASYEIVAKGWLRESIAELRRD
jgi:hypothetical protein